MRGDAIREATHPDVRRAPFGRNQRMEPGRATNEQPEPGRGPVPFKENDLPFQDPVYMFCLPGCPLGFPSWSF